MAKEKLTLECTSAVSPDTKTADVSDPIIAGKRIRLKEMRASVPGGKNIVAYLVWDYGGANEKILWSLHGPGIVGRREVPEQIAVGGEKIALVCENAEEVSIVVSAKARIRIYDS